MYNMKYPKNMTWNELEEFAKGVRYENKELLKKIYWDLPFIQACNFILILRKFGVDVSV